MPVIPLYKTTIVIWSTRDPMAAGMDLEALADDAANGDSYCSSMTRIRVETPEADPHWDGTEFFDRVDEGCAECDRSYGPGRAPERCPHGD